MGDQVFSVAGIFLALSVISCPLTSIQQRVRTCSNASGRYAIRIHYSLTHRYGTIPPLRCSFDGVAVLLHRHAWVKQLSRAPCSFA
jgi:hypothetical protein